MPVRLKKFECCACAIGISYGFAAESAAGRETLRMLETQTPPRYVSLCASDYFRVLSTYTAATKFALAISKAFRARARNPRPPPNPLPEADSAFPPVTRRLHGPSKAALR